MHRLIILLIVSVTTFDYVEKLGWLPGIFKYVPELISAFTTVYVLAMGVQNQFRYVRATYWLMFGALLVVFVCGALNNALAPGPLFLGLRWYLRALPLFFLPAVFSFEEKHVRSQLVLILGVCLLQIPIATYQRTTSFTATFQSGDWTIGTLMNSAILSIFLICAACVLAGFYIRKRLSLKVFLPLFLLVLFPTTINETKGTLVLVPLGLLTTFIAGSRRGVRLKNGLLALGLLAAFGAIFVPVYDYYVKKRWGYGIVEFITMPGRVEGYMSKDAEVGGKDAGRVDGIVVPLRELAKDPSHLVFGLGAGNTADSTLGLQFQGSYYRAFEPFLQSSASTILLESGLLGISLVTLLMLIVFRESVRVAEIDDGLVGDIAVGWTGVTMVMAMALYYKNIIAFGSLSFLFWYFSGLVAARRMRLAMQGPARAAAPASRPRLSANHHAIN